MIMAAQEKRWVQVKIEKDLVDDVEAILSELGLNQTTAINMLYKRIVANGALPFDVSLSEEEKANLRFLKATEDIPVIAFKDAQEVADWLNDPNA